MCNGHENKHILICFWPASDFSGIKERTLVAVKPDGVQRRLIGDVIKRFEQRGFRLVGLKMLQVSEGLTQWETFMCETCLCIMCLCTFQASDKLLAQHYVSLQKKPFYSSLLYYMTSGPVVAMVRSCASVWRPIINIIQL